MNNQKVLELAQKVWSAAGGTVYSGPSIGLLAEFAALVEREVRGCAGPVAWIDSRSLDTISNFDATVYGNGSFDFAQPLYTHPATSVVRQLVDALQGMFNIAIDSQGVAGYHLNGEIAEWDDFEEIDKVKAALAAAKDSGL